MTRMLTTFGAALLGCALLAGPSTAQTMPLFDSRAALEEAIATHMADGTFSALVEAVAPPTLMSVARVRTLEQAFEGQVPPLRQSVTIFGDDTETPIARAVTAWWDGDLYVYLGLMTHAREDGLAVLDFILTTDLRRAARWYLTARPQ